ncbi:MAG: phenylalanine--tRNA ligase subunit beta [Bacteroidota bacterium]
MKISRDWLSDFIDLTQPAEELAEVLTQTGLEIEGVEEVEQIPGSLEGLVVGEVVSCDQHPNADKLKLTQVDVGEEEPLPIVCGAPNVATGQKVIVALVNTTIHPTSGDPFKIKKSKIRGEVSMGMICAEDEIGLGSSHDGIMVLDTEKPNGTPVREIFQPGVDTVFEIGLTPNRGDAASHLGTARDLKAFYKQPLKAMSQPTFEIQEVDPISVVVENSEACPRYSGVTIRDIKVGPSPDWLQFRLRAIGLSPINNIVDITNYVLHGLGQPLHAFDADQVTGGKVVVKTLAEGSAFVTLDEKERKLNANDLMICNAEEGMCIAGVFGGIKSGMTEASTSVFLESAYFSQDWVRATAMRHGLSTDASFRYERGTDPEMTMKALKYATQLILDIAGGYVASDFVDIYPQRVEPKKIHMPYRNFEWLIGKKLPEDEINDILQRLDIQVAPAGDHMVATVPAYRSEVTRPADLVEEVLRIHGINNIDIDESFSTEYLAEFEENEPYNIQEELSLFLVGQGYQEIVTNSLTNPAYYEKYPLGGEPVEILNKSSLELGILKTDPLYTAIEVLRHNINRKMPNLKLYEFCKTYEQVEGSYKETEWLTLYLSGQTEESWMAPSRPFTFHELAGVAGGLFYMQNISVNTTVLEAGKTFQYGLQYTSGHEPLGEIGLLQPDLTALAGVDQEVYHLRISWSKFLELTTKKLEFEDLSKFPEVRRDLSLVLDKSISFKEIEELAFKSEKKLLTRVNVFSIYEGENIGGDKKAYAISFFLQDREKTLTDKLIDKVMGHLIKQFESQIGAIIRK